MTKFSLIKKGEDLRVEKSEISKFKPLEMRFMGGVIEIVVAEVEIISISPFSMLLLKEVGDAYTWYLLNKVYKKFKHKIKSDEIVELKNPSEIGDITFEITSYKSLSLEKIIEIDKEMKEMQKKMNSQEDERINVKVKIDGKTAEKTVEIIRV